MTKAEPTLAPICPDCGGELQPIHADERSPGRRGAWVGYCRTGCRKVWHPEQLSTSTAAAVAQAADAFAEQAGLPGMPAHTRRFD